MDHLTLETIKYCLHNQSGCLSISPRYDVVFMHLPGQVPVAWFQGTDFHRLFLSPFYQRLGLTYPPFQIARVDQGLHCLNECIAQLEGPQYTEQDLAFLTSAQQFLLVNVDNWLWELATTTSIPSKLWLQAFPQTKVNQLVHFSGDGDLGKAPTYLLLSWVLVSETHVIAQLRGSQETLIANVDVVHEQGDVFTTRVKEDYRFVDCSASAFMFHDQRAFGKLYPVGSKCSCNQVTTSSTSNVIGSSKPSSIASSKSSSNASSKPSSIASSKPSSIASSKTSATASSKPPALAP